MITYHSHLGEINKAFFGKVWCSLFNKCQVCQVHPQIRNSWRVTAAKPRDTGLKLIHTNSYSPSCVSQEATTLLQSWRTKSFNSVCTSTLTILWVFSTSHNTIEQKTTACVVQCAWDNGMFKPQDVLQTNTKYALAVLVCGTYTRAALPQGVRAWRNLQELGRKIKVIRACKACFLLSLVFQCFRG